MDSELIVFPSYDIAYRSGSEPNNASRADFFTGSAVNSLRGYRALAQERLPLEQLARRSAWHYDWTSTLSQFVPDISHDTQEMYNSLKRYDLITDDYRPGPSLRTETEAREQLTLDLALASDIYTAHAIKQQEYNAQLDDAFETMSRATEAMSIGVPEPAAVHFGFLRPDIQDHYSREGSQETQHLQLPLGVRLLLSEWEVGADPRAYEYRDPYDNTEPRPVHPRAAKKAAEKVPATEQKTLPLRMPPTIAVAPMAPPPIAASQPARPRPMTQSQGTDVHQEARQSPQSTPVVMQHSQEMLFPSTQILPGPFGGRPAPVKKKPAKKRMGGF